MLEQVGRISFRADILSYILYGESRIQSHNERDHFDLLTGMKVEFSQEGGGPEDIPPQGFDKVQGLKRNIRPNKNIITLQLTQELSAVQVVTMMHGEMSKNTEALFEWLMAHDAKLHNRCGESSRLEVQDERVSMYVMMRLGELYGEEVSSNGYTRTLMHMDYHVVAPLCFNSTANAGSEVSTYRPIMEWKHLKSYTKNYNCQESSKTLKANNANYSNLWYSDKKEPRFGFCLTKSGLTPLDRLANTEYVAISHSWHAKIEYVLELTDLISVTEKHYGRAGKKVWYDVYSIRPGMKRMHLLPQ
jgi:hypothetical protein